MLTGSKTYIIAAALIALALAAFVVRATGPNQTLEIIFAALALASMRAGVKKIEIAALIMPPTWVSKIGGLIPHTKTHLATAFMVLTAVLAWLTGEQGAVVTALVIAAAAGLSAVRQAIKRVHDFVKEAMPE